MPIHKLSNNFKSSKRIPIRGSGGPDPTGDATGVPWGIEIRSNKDKTKENCSQYQRPYKKQ